MERVILQELKIWKNSKDRKPLILKGARQVGKTWIMNEFGKHNYKNYVYFNFDEEEELKSLFKSNKNPKHLIELLSMLRNEKIEPENSLIIFDEIQECAEALNSLKYFKEKANEYHIVTAGSLLSTFLAEMKSYPVGMVNVKNVSPLTFSEYLLAVDSVLYNYYINIKKMML